MLKIKKIICVNKNLGGFTLIEVLIILILSSIFLTSIIFAQRNILKQNEKYRIESEMLNECKNYIYRCQASGKILNHEGDISVIEIDSNNVIADYRYIAKEGNNKIEVDFSICKK